MAAIRAVRGSRVLGPDRAWGLFGVLSRLSGLVSSESWAGAVLHRIFMAMWAFCMRSSQRGVQDPGDGRCRCRPWDPDVRDSARPDLRDRADMTPVDGAFAI